MNNSYQVQGDLASEKSSEAYPTMVLCEDCVANHEVLVDEGPSNEDCEDCGNSSDE
ncbi:hypothetical protein SAMN05216550_117172 [Paraburkholderia tropica]|uniref:Uncharacterized protein n=1 Tax=Paraburkholderia tropica TaxID=92647 RepID=A0AAQ1GKQ0_9BURK|nr:hypothetical protein SAMN05216550_117172 [Paraburkholderia tropica]